LKIKLLTGFGGSLQLHPQKMKFLEKHNATILEGNNTPLTRSVVPVDISQIADWYFQEAEVYETNLRDQFPSVVAPFPVTYFEYKIPATWKVRNPKTEVFDLVKTPHDATDKFACLIIQEKLPDNFTGHDPYEGQVLNQILAGLKEPAKPRFKQFTFFFAGNHEDCVPACWVTNYVDENGRMMGGPVSDIHHTLRSRSSQPEGEAYGDLIRCYGYPIYFALSLLACKNVSLRARGISDKDRKQAARVKSIPFDYRDVVIAPLRKSITAGEHGPGNGIVTAMRIAGGHWKDYTQGNGLFGKVHGRFWWDDYVKVMRGTEKAVEELATYRMVKK
jgi:hypothetical protein